MELFEYTEKLIKNGLDGSNYFDLVDEFIRTHSEVLKKLHNTASNKHIVLSGKIAEAMTELGIEVHLTAPGGIRKGNKVNFYDKRTFIAGKSFTFIDDSYYKGRTYRAIKAEIEKYGGTCDEVIVAYDGGYDKGVKSLVSYAGLLANAIGKLDEKDGK